MADGTINIDFKGAADQVVAALKEAEKSLTLVSLFAELAPLVDKTPVTVEERVKLIKAELTDRESAGWHNRDQALDDAANILAYVLALDIAISETKRNG